MDTALSQKIQQLFAASRGTYGTPRLRAALQQQGVHCSRARIGRLLSSLGLSVQLPQRRVTTTRLGTYPPAIHNLLARQFSAAQPNTVWLADITYIPTQQGWLYLAGVLDLFSRRIVGWAFADTLHDELTQAALAMALSTRQPSAPLLHHSDRGSQYTSAQYLALLAAQPHTVSFSRTGDCFDNAPMERFWGTLKTECVYRTAYPTRSAARSDIFAYIEGFYNRSRLHTALGCLSPLQFEERSLTR